MACQSRPATWTAMPAAAPMALRALVAATARAAASASSETEAGTEVEVGAATAAAVVRMALLATVVAATPWSGSAPVTATDGRGVALAGAGARVGGVLRRGR